MRDVAHVEYLSTKAITHDMIGDHDSVAEMGVFGGLGSPSHTKQWYSA